MKNLTRVEFLNAYIDLLVQRLQKLRERALAANAGLGEGLELARDDPQWHKLLDEAKRVLDVLPRPEGGGGGACDYKVGGFAFCTTSVSESECRVNLQGDFRPGGMCDPEMKWDFL